eukprot:TRINITY_DN6649_c0_g1_i1.p1 TRINITY_DN6649_c0_g1~~TRINITY_DN6649_c0_g1_i1.p1  ORF type:complete len:421 (-),score=57.85 TRINITY_DN6649_c0_g1_i1:481-1683(-)
MVAAHRRARTRRKAGAGGEGEAGDADVAAEPLYNRFTEGTEHPWLPAGPVVGLPSAKAAGVIPPFGGPSGGELSGREVSTTANAVSRGAWAAAASRRKKALAVASPAVQLEAASAASIVPLAWIEYLENEGPDDLRPEDMPRVLRLVQGQVLAYSLDAIGCRLVQRALELAIEQELRWLLQELKGHVCEALESPHANHVLQKAIAFARPATVFFILKEALQWGEAANLARHQYGCRLIERLIEHFPLQALADMIDNILLDAPALSRHVYGNFVMQHLLEYGAMTHRQRIVEILRANLGSSATHHHMSRVLDKALTYAPPDDQRRLAEELLEQDGLLLAMASQHHGFSPTQRLLKVLDPVRRRQAHRQLEAGAQKLQRATLRALLASFSLDEYENASIHMR